MNSCVLMAEITKDPELRYLPDGQTAIAEMTVQFPALRAEDPMETLKVVGWGNLAQQIQEQFHSGDQVILEGRLNMVVVDRPEGFKEKRAELTVNRLHRVQTDLNAPRIASTPMSAPQTSYAPPASPAPVAPTPTTPPPAVATPAPGTVRPPVPQSGNVPPIPDDLVPNYDDIPF